MSRRRLQDISWRHFEDVFSVTISCLPSRLQGISKTSWRRIRKTSDDVLTSWKTKNCYTEEVFKTYLEDIFMTSWISTTAWYNCVLYQKKKKKKYRKKTYEKATTSSKRACLTAGAPCGFCLIRCLILLDCPNNTSQWTFFCL